MYRSPSMDPAKHIQNTQSIKYTIVPAEVDIPENERRYRRRGFLPKGVYNSIPKKVQGGVIINGVFFPSYETEQSLKSLKEHVKSQIELCFQDENLEKNLFLRQYMDIEGYIPITVLTLIPAIQMLTLDAVLLHDLLLSMPQFTVNEQCKTFRLKENWEKYLVERENGTKGVPKYQPISEN
ncbi:hypothetical protein WA158_000760 [Blastocystis sp. Blastoise]